MADRKATCPGCGSRTTSVFEAMADGEPCPYCGAALPQFDPPDEVLVAIEGTGVQQFVAGERLARASAAFDRDVEYATKSGSHLWIVALAHRLSTDQARLMTEGRSDAVPLDAESLVVSGTGCYICETPLSARLLNRRCKGEPK